MQVPALRPFAHHFLLSLKHIPQSCLNLLKLLMGSGSKGSGPERAESSATKNLGTKLESMGLLGAAVFSPDEVAGMSCLRHLLWSCASDDFELRSRAVALTVQDVLHTVAFQGETLGAPLMCNHHSAETMNGDVIAKFKAGNFSPSRLVVSAVGVEHARMVEYVEEHLGDLAKGSPAPIASATYAGGDMRVPGEAGQVHVAIGLRGVDCSDKDVVASAVLQSLLGGGDQFSAGGPGKGLTSRIFRNVLSNPVVLSATSFNVSYQDAGLFGMQATCNAHDAPKTVALLTRELAALRGAISAEELERAKNMTASSLFLNLETMGIVSEDLGRQTMFYGKRKDGATVAAEINAVTADDLSKLSAKMLASPVSVAAYGDVAFVPAYAEIAAALK